MSRCAEPHPSLPVKCVAPERFPNHDNHFANHEGEPVEWRNERYVPNATGDAIDPSHRSFVKQRVVDVANQVRGIDDNHITQPSQPTQTQESAGSKVLPASGTQRRYLYDAYVESGEDGLTDEEAEEVTGLKPNSIRPRRGELMEGGFVAESGRQRINSNGNAENVYVAVRVTTPLKNL